MSTPWTLFVVALTLLNIGALVWLLFANSRARPGDPAKDSTTGHVWDGDLAELNNPLPRWWFGLFVLTIVFSIGYLVLYPGLGDFAGKIGWTSVGAADRARAARSRASRSRRRFRAVARKLARPRGSARRGDSDRAPRVACGPCGRGSKGP